MDYNDGKFIKSGSVTDFNMLRANSNQLFGKPLTQDYSSTATGNSTINLVSTNYTRDVIKEYKKDHLDLFEQAPKKGIDQDELNKKRKIKAECLKTKDELREEIKELNKIIKNLEYLIKLEKANSVRNFEKLYISND